MAYVYRGAEQETITRGDGHVMQLKPCGTEAAYKRHLARGEVADEKCLAAHRMAMREYDRRTNTRPRRKVVACGTPAGYRRHKRLDEPVDDACRLAHNQAVNAHRIAKKEAAA